MEAMVEDAGVRVGLLEVDVHRYAATFAGRPLDLSRTQIELLAFLIEHRGRVTSRKEISAAIGLQRGRSVDVVLTALRHTIGRSFVRNVRGRGWIIDIAALNGD